MSKAIYSSEHKQLVSLLKKTRLALGLTQKVVAQKLGKSQSYVSKVESGQRTIDVVELQSFAKVYKKNINYFI